MGRREGRAGPQTARARQRAEALAAAGGSAPEGPYREFGSEQEYNAWAKDHYGAWASNLTPEEFAGVGAYTYLPYKFMNGTLRGQDLKQIPGYNSDYLPNAANFPAWIAGMKSALGKTGAPENMVLWRGQTARKTDTFDAFTALSTGRLKVGGILEDRAFQSATFSRDWALTYAKRGGGAVTGHVLYKINVPKGTPGAAIYVHPQAWKQDKEFTLQAGTKHRVTAIRQAGTAPDGKPILEVDLTVVK